MKLCWCWLIVAAGVGVLMDASPAPADPDSLLDTTLLLIKPAKLAKFISKDAITLPTADPTVDGGTLQILDGTGAAVGDDNVYALPAANWVGLGSPPGSGGYKYQGAGTVDDPCTLVVVRPKILKAICKGPGVTLITPFDAHAHVVLTLGTTNAKRYCAEAGGITKRNRIQLLKRVAAPAPAACPVSLPPPPPPGQLCLLDDAASGIAFRSEAVTIPVMPLKGTIGLSCGSMGADGVAPCTCEAGAFAPTVVPSIGDICLHPSGACPAGAVDCDGGEALDVDMRAVHAVVLGGPAPDCTSNAACNAKCASYCTGLGASYTVLRYGCEGFCLDGTNDDSACTDQSDCPGGACVGGESSPATFHPGACNCVCRGNGGVSSAGSLACNVGIQIDVELPPDGDCADAGSPGVSHLSVPPVCVPMTTGAATALISNANFMAGHTVPAMYMPDTASGSPISCSTLATGATTGMRTVGHLADFDSFLGDWLWTLTFTCR